MNGAAPFSSGDPGALSSAPRLLGHDAIRQRLGAAAAADRLPHALLFCGPDGVGKRTVALALAADLIAGEDREERTRCDRLQHDRLLVYTDLDKPLPVRRRDLFDVVPDEQQLLATYEILREEGWLEGVDPAPGPDVIDLLARNPERFTGRKGIPFAEVLERELAGLERSRRSDAATLEVARRLFATGTAQALYRRSLGIELINGKGDGAHFRTVESLLRTSAGGAWRVVIIDDAHKMTDAAENAFLKTLEEPPAGTVIILVTAEPFSLLPTTLSRCARVVFRSLPTPELADFLVGSQGVAAEEGTLLATLADGSVGAALALRGCDLVARRRAIETMLPGIAAGDLARTLAQVGSRLGGVGARGAGARGAGGAARDAVRAEARLLLELLALCFRDLILLRSLADAGGEAAAVGLVSGMEADFARQLAARRSAREWETLFRRVETAAEDVALSVEPRLAVEALFTDTLTPVGRTA